MKGIDESLSEPYKVGHASCDLTPYTDKGLEGFNVKWLTNLKVEPDKRNTGEAKKLLAQLGKEADAAQVAIILEPRGFEESIEQSRLESLYKRHGFISVQDEPKLMLRVPVPPMLFEQLKKKETSRIITNIYR
jgi:hypothetical protein